MSKEDIDNYNAKRLENARKVFPTKREYSLGFYYWVRAYKIVMVGESEWDCPYHKKICKSEQELWDLYQSTIKGIDPADCLRTKKLTDKP